MKETAKFGEFVKQTRLRNGITARQASEGAGMLPSNFSKLEHGALNAPKDMERQKKLAFSIGLDAKDEDSFARFFDLAAQATNSVPVDIAEIISEVDALPLLLRTIGNKRLSKGDIKRLVEIVRGTASADSTDK